MNALSPGLRVAILQESMPQPDDEKKYKSAWFFSLSVSVVPSCITFEWERKKWKKKKKETEWGDNGSTVFTSRPNQIVMVLIICLFRSYPPPFPSETINGASREKWTIANILLPMALKLEPGRTLTGVFFWLI